MGKTKEEIALRENSSKTKIRADGSLQKRVGKARVTRSG